MAMVTGCIKRWVTYVTEEFEQDDVSILEKLIYKISDMTKKIRNIKK